MWKFFLLASFASAFSPDSVGQLKKQFSVGDMDHVKEVSFRLSAKTGNCFIRPNRSAEVLNVYSNQDLEAYNHTFSQEIINGTCYLSLALAQEGQKGVGQKISYQVFGGEEKASTTLWKVYLTEDKPYLLDLDYGLGNANIDLSGLSVKNLKVKTGSADVNIFYGSNVENNVTMDTFLVKVDMGSLNVRQMSLARSQVVMADVGFGNILLDFSDNPSNSNHIMGSVGAGNLVILLPTTDVPVLVKINDSWLCTLDLCKSLKRVGGNTFANKAYRDGASNALTFDLDVSLGKIVFRDKPE